MNMLGIAVLNSDFADLNIPPDLPVIPAMSGDAERRYYYWLARQYSGQGAVVELGPWLGASTAYIAAGVRDSGFPTKIQVFDQFVWRVGGGWESKGAGERAAGTSFLDEFKMNLGPLGEHVEAHQQEIRDITWDGLPVELLFLDAPKRMPEISWVLTTFGPSLLPGTSIMVWQDFAHFPSFAIPASLSRLWDMIEPIHVVTPGSTLAFRVLSRWTAGDVSEKALALKKWTPEQIDDAWKKWKPVLPSSAWSLFFCGSIMFLHDIGQIELARKRLRSLLDTDADRILPKWRHLATTSLSSRYAALFKELSII